jgi:putative acetyltransferase
MVASNSTVIVIARGRLAQVAGVVAPAPRAGADSKRSENARTIRETRVEETDMLIREEIPKDVERIGAVIEAAFETAAVSSGSEVEIVERLRSAGALLLSLVAERSGRIVGHVAVSATTIGEQGDWALIGPMAVLPGFQSRGIGSALMEDALRRLRSAGLNGAALVGDPAYYGRFGFRAWPGLKLHGVPDKFVLALPFTDGVPNGALAHHEAFGLGA